MNYRLLWQLWSISKDLKGLYITDETKKEQMISQNNGALPQNEDNKYIICVEHDVNFATLLKHHL